MFNDLYYIYRPPDFIVLPDYRKIEGQITRGNRQIDVVVLHRDRLSRPFISVESKFYSRKVDVKQVEAFIGMEQDLGSEHAFMVAPNGFTDLAHLRVQGTNITLLTLPTTEAERLNWREVARQCFTIDQIYHPEMGDAIHLFNTTNENDDLLSVMEELPFEEWDALFHIYLKVDEQRCRLTLERLSLMHGDDGWVFNTVRLLDEFGWLDEHFVKKLNAAGQIERDLAEYLHDCGLLS